MAIIASVYVVLAALRLRSEETAGHTEPLLTAGLSRGRWMAGHLGVVLLGGAVVLLLAGIGLGVTGALVLEDPAFLGTVLGATLPYVPALWVTGGVAVALFGLLPRATALAWLVPLYAFTVGYLGQILRFPEWMNALSPFGHVPQLPAEDFSLLPLVGLTALTAALIAVGAAGFRQRDLATA